MFACMPHRQNPEGGTIRRIAIRWAAQERTETPQGMVYLPVARTDYIAAFTKLEAESSFNQQMHMLYRTGNIQDLLVEDVYDVADRREELSEQYAQYEGEDN